MTKTLTLLSALALLLSCQKEITDETVGGGASSSLPGTYRFVGMRAHTKADGSVSDGTGVLRFVTFSTYNTENNGGTLTLTADSAFTHRLTYSVSATAKGYQYLNGQLEDSVEFPFATIVPPSSGSTRYRVIGRDSIYFENGFLNSSSGPAVTQPSGLRFRTEGTRLIFLQRAEFSSTDNSTGVPIRMKNSLNAEVTFEKQ